MEATDTTAKSCYYFTSNICRSCSLLDLSYEEQLLKKDQKLKELFSSAASISPIVPSDPTFGSRCRAKIAVSGTASAPILGLVDQALKGRELSACPLHHPLVNKILKEAREAIFQFGLTPYDIKKRSGELKYMLLRVLPNSYQVSFRFVAQSTQLIDRFREAGKYLLAKVPALKTVSLNIQPIPHSIIEGPEELPLAGPATLTEKMDNLSFVVSPQSFAQVTPNVAQKLYQHVASIVANNPTKLSYDLFCGGGYISAFVAAHVERGIGVELSEIAVEDAVQTAAKNKLDHISFIAADVTDFLKQCSEEPDLIIVNPPRRGLGEPICELIAKLKPKRVIYSSCNPVTLARDVALLSSYQVAKLAPFDMFPFTEHFETVADLILAE